MGQHSSPDSDSNIRPYGIFFTYLSMCLAVTLFIISKLVARRQILRAAGPSEQPRTRHIVMFAVLAVCSLLSTWSFMFRYFEWSYDNWLTLRAQGDLDPSVKHWGIWLKDTSLFKEAWESVIVGHDRFWWSHQIFFFATALGLHSEWKGPRRGIAHTWAFMLLGQIVAISFATNLYFLTLLLSPPREQPVTAPTKSSSSKAGRPIPRSKSRTWFGPWIIDGLSTLVTSTSAELLAKETYWNGAPGFMPVLLLPHVALMIVPTARAILPARLFPTDEASTLDKIYGALLLFNSYFVGRLALTTYHAYTAGTLSRILVTLLEHPAVSSVGFDVIFCWISWLCWWQTQGQNPAAHAS